MNTLLSRLSRPWRLDIHPADRRRVWQITFMTLVITMASYGSAPFIPIVLAADGHSGATIGIVIGALALGTLIGQMPAAFVAARLGPRSMLVLILSLEVVAALGFALTRDVGVYCLTRFVAGMGQAGITQTIRVVIAASVPSGARGKAFGIVGGSSMAGILIGPVGAGFVVAMAGSRSVFVAVAGLCALMICLVVAGPRFRRASGSEVEGLTAPEPGSAAVPVPRTSPYLLAGVIIEVAAASLLIGVFHSAWSLFLSERGASPQLVGLAWGLFAVPYLFLAPVIGALSDRFNRKAMALSGTVVSGLAALAYPEIHTLTLLLCGEFIAAVTGAMSEPALDAMAADASEGRSAGRVFGLVGLAESGGQIVGILSGGVLLAFGTSVPLQAGGVTVLVLCLAAGTCFRQARPRRVVSTQSSHVRAIP